MSGSLKGAVALGIALITLGVKECVDLGCKRNLDNVLEHTRTGWKPEPYGGGSYGGSSYDGSMRGGGSYDGSSRGGSYDGSSRGGGSYDGSSLGGGSYDGISRGGSHSGGVTATDQPSVEIGSVDVPPAPPVRCDRCADIGAELAIDPPNGDALLRIELEKMYPRHQFQGSPESENMRRAWWLGKLKASLGTRAGVRATNRHDAARLVLIEKIERLLGDEGISALDPLLGLGLEDFADDLLKKLIKDLTVAIGRGKTPAERKQVLVDIWTRRSRKTITTPQLDQLLAGPCFGLRG